MLTPENNRIRPIPYVVGFGDARPFLWIDTIEGGDEKTLEALLKKQHIAFTAESLSALKAAPTLPFFFFHSNPLTAFTPLSPCFTWDMA
jgi:hypothetical protein